MPIDRRITNGLAWAGAVLVVAIPAADFALRQASPASQPQVSVVQPQSPAQPSETGRTPQAERPQQVAETAELVSASEVEADPIVTAQNAPRPASESGDPVDSFLQSGRDLPSYISGGSAGAGTSAPAATRPPAAAPQQQQQASVQPAVPAAAHPPATSAPVPPVRPQVNVTLPTPVSQRPPSVPQSQARPAAPAQQPPLVIREPNDILTAEDLEDWESGPLSEFLANRGQQPAAQDYDADGFFLDEGPNNSGREQFPRAYGEGFYYPFSD
jgi:hypothetical protein